ncbi:MAG: 1-acyl-sn-glycerol-3-phosphate acyltransferase [Flavobacteriaceae bacterium]|nr:1-acyl-sn-glycerol-3-phosphate acyltransferase [Flavobacteriaceae bacterium]
MTNFEEIRFFHDHEVQPALHKYVNHPMIKALLQFTFPEKSFEEIEQIVASCHSIHDFQAKVIYFSVNKVLEKSSEGLTYGGFDKLKKDESYLFISNHRDIILDTGLINYALFEQGLIMTASAIGDNLVKKPFLMLLSKLIRNFLVQRGLSPRGMLRSSQNLSEYIRHLLIEEKRSVWLAQREGRTKDGNDVTQQGVLKMLAMAKGELSLSEYFSKIKIVPIAISYEFDPTDALKMPEIMAKRMDEEYTKTAHEDFNSILKGALGKKGRIHLEAGKVLNEDWFNGIIKEESSVNDQLKSIAKGIDQKIHKNYKLWPSNYIACDLLNNNEEHRFYYTLKGKRQFERRLTRRIDLENSLEVNSYLLMYANPVINKESLDESQL